MVHPVGRPPNGERAMTSAEQKAAQRRRDRAAGLIEVTVKIPVGRVQELRKIAAKWLEKPEEKSST
jgi:hypothetical protein